MKQEKERKGLPFFGIPKLAPYLKPYKMLFFWMVVAGTIGSGMDAVIPLFQQHAIDHFIADKTMQGVGGWLALYILVMIIQTATNYISAYGACKAELYIGRDLKRETFNHLQTLSFSYFNQNSVGYTHARVMSDTDRIASTLAWGLMEGVWYIAYLLLAIVMMFLLNWKLALCVMVIVPVLVLSGTYFQKKLVFFHRRVREQNSKITGAFNEGIMGAMTTKTLVREDANAKEFNELTETMRGLSTKSARMSAAFFPLVISLGAIGTGLALTIGGYGVLGTGAAFIGSITVGTLVSFVSYTTQLFDPIQQIAGVLAEFQSAQASAERVIDLIDTQSEIVDRRDVIEKYGDILHEKRENWEPLHGDIRFEHVSFAYKQGEKVLSDFNLDVHQGETIALVGETGAGKSTIVNLVCRFYEPTEGRILIDGKDYRERSQLWLQSHLGYVLQAPHLFSGTIRDNIAFGRPDAAEEEIREAARLVHADVFIEKQKDGYDTEVGEGGARLSVGQKQLISFARVMLANPRIFVLDEATSSIDTETEQLIQDAIQNVLKGRTSFIVAHRLSTIRSADRILVIREGKVQESGTHDELLAQKGYYYNLYTHQYREEALQQTLSEKNV